MNRQTALWTLAALAGIVLTAGITWATSQLTSQHIGLSSEPLSAGHGLAPPVADRAAPTRPRPTPTVRPKVTAPPPSRGTSSTTSQAPRATTSPSTSIAPETPAPVTPPARTSERAPAPRPSGSSGDDGGDHRQHGGERAEREGGEEGRSSRGRDD